MAVENRPMSIERCMKRPEDEEVRKSTGTDTTSFKENFHCFLHQAMNISIITTIVGELTMNPREQYVYTHKYRYVYIYIDTAHQKNQPSRPMIHDI